MLDVRPQDGSAAVEELEQDETPPRQSKADDLLGMLSKFLESAGNVLLVQGPPGVGKTTLALELLRRVKATRLGSTEIPPARFYVPSRVSSNKLRKHFPWIHGTLSPESKHLTRDSPTEGTSGIHVSEADDVFNKVLNMKRSKLRGLMVIDSWEGALRNTSEDGRRMIESAILSDPDDNMVGVVLVSEGSRIGDLPNLVDGIVTLSSSELDGRRLRTIVVNKLRGFRVKSDRALFSLDRGRFNLLPQTRIDSIVSAKAGILTPVRHTATHFSTGSRDLDAMLNGGIRKGSSTLVDVNSNVPTIAVRLLSRIINANFVNQGGSSFIIPFSTVSSNDVAEFLKPLIGEESLNQRVRIVNYDQNLPRKRWRVQMTGKVNDDFLLFSNIWKELRSKSSSMVLAIDFDRLVHVYGDDLMLPVLANMGASIRDAGAVTLAAASEPNKIRESFLRSVDYHFRIENVNDTMVVYGVKPFTNVHGIEFAFDRGYPSLRLTEIV